MLFSELYVYYKNRKQRKGGLPTPTNLTSSTKDAAISFARLSGYAWGCMGLCVLLGYGVALTLRSLPGTETTKKVPPSTDVSVTSATSESKTPPVA